jgi:acyl-CoA synthetase (AMP-forming)/AMP-acid ligase II
LPGARFYNLYGPTETNVCTWHEVVPEDLAEGNETPIPIGRACPNVGVFALNADGRPVTNPGQSGELWVRGAGVALGYWGDPELTASRFPPNPLISDYHDPAYRTGDSVTLGADGKNWFFQGRSDCMVKSRGFRIELGDIEACLYRSGEIRDAVVVAPRNELTGARIVAFVVPVDNQSPQENRLLSWCRGQLPRYMVPERIFLRGELPRTSSGKFNRKQLEHEAGTQ